MSLSRYRRYRNLLNALRVLEALGESCVCTVFYFVIVGIADSILEFSTTSRIVTLLLGTILFVTVLFLLLFRVWKKSAAIDSSMESYLGLKHGELTAAIYFQKLLQNQSDDNTIGSTELAVSAIENVDSVLYSAHLNRWLFSQISWKRGLVELTILLIVLISLFSIYRSESRLAFKRILNPNCLESYRVTVPESVLPQIESVAIRVVPPPATMTASFDIQSDSDVTVPADSTIRFRISLMSKRDSLNGYLQIKDKSSENSITLESIDNNISFKAEQRWTHSAKYRFVFYEQKNTVLETPWKTINVKPDEVPMAELQACQMPNMEVVSDAMIPLKIVSSDDYGLTSTSLQWRVLKPEEVQSGIKPNKIVYQRQPVWDAFQDESLTRPPKQRTEETTLNLSTLELQSGAQLDVLAQAIDTHMEEGDSSLLRLKIVTPEELNAILISARIRIASELRRALDTLHRIQKESKSDAIASLYSEFARQTWDNKDGVQHQLRALVERVKMNHAPWGRTLVELDKAGNQLNTLQTIYDKQIKRLLEILRLDSSDKQAKQQLDILLQKLSEEVSVTVDSFGHWTQYRELCESFKTIHQSVLTLEKQTRDRLNSETVKMIQTQIPKIGSQTQLWLTTASESSMIYRNSDSVQYPQAQKWSESLEQIKTMLNENTLRTLLTQATATQNTVTARAAITHLRELYDRAWAILSASGDDVAQKRLLLKAELEQIYEQQQVLNQDVKALESPEKNRENVLNQAQIADKQSALAQRIETLDVPNMTVVSDSLFQTRTLMSQAADFIRHGDVTDKVVICQQAATKHLIQILDTLNEAEQLAILALNRANNSDETQEDKKSEETEPDKGKPQSKVSIEDLKLLELQQRQLLEDTRHAYADALDSGSLKLSEESATVLIDRQQRLASLTWFLTTITVSPELLHGERPKEKQEISDSLDEVLLGNMSDNVTEQLSETEIAEREQRKKEQEFLDTVWNELGTAAVSEEDAPLLEIVRFMRQTYELFKERDGGEINQGLQEQICNHFESFINQFSFSREKSKEESKNKSDNPQDNNMESNKENQPSDNPDDQQTVDTSAPGANEKTSDGATQQLTEEQLKALKRRIWGELPPEIQRSVPLDDNTIPLPDYRHKIDKYWKELEERTK